MASGNSKSYDYESVILPKKSGKSGAKDISSISPPKQSTDTSKNIQTFSSNNPPEKLIEAEQIIQNGNTTVLTENSAALSPSETENSSYSEKKKQEKATKKSKKDIALLQSDRWIVKNGHKVTFAGVFLFSFFVFFRPYELIPSLGFLTSGAFIIALATLAIYVPTQITTEGTLTILTTEVKCVLAMTFLALMLVPISRDPALAWESFNDTFIKAILMFIVMINVVRSRKRLMALLWIAISISIYLSFTAINLYQKGEFRTEGYRVSVDVKGLFENPNEMSLHLVMIIPIVLALGIAAKNRISKIIYFSLTALFVAANVVTFSRGGFLGFIVAMGVFAWKIGRNNRFKTAVISLLAGGIIVLAAPGNYGIRLLSIFIPGLDPVGSSDLRKENLILSVLVTIRNPWGIGLGNSITYGARNLQTHNAFTQVSSELGLLGFAAYMILMISPFRKLGAIERTLFKKGERGWFYYLAIGLQASIAGYMVSSFFASVAYIWFIYYLIAYAVAFRRIYQIEKGLKEEIKAEPFGQVLWSPKTA